MAAAKLRVFGLLPQVGEALRSYTIWAARQLFLDERTESLEVGKNADIAVWTQNPYNMPSRELRNLHCEATILGGEIVFDAGNNRGP